jgi:hypothetical protein
VKISSQNYSIVSVTSSEDCIQMTADEEFTQNRIVTLEENSTATDVLNV